LRNEAMARVEFDYPSSLQAFDVTQNNAEHTFITGHFSVFDVINIAREADVLRLLPVAFYKACTLPFDDIFDGIHRGDGPRACLSMEDQKNCIKGWRTLMTMQMKKTFGWLDPDHPVNSCQTPARCDILRKNIRLGRRTWDGKALEPWNKSWGQHLCCHCERQAKSGYDMGRGKVWENLPAVFGLPMWNEILER